MSNDERVDRWELSLDEAVEHWFEESSRCGEPPEIAVVYGDPVSGKTRLRHDQYSDGYVTVDAGDMFRYLEQGRILAFPDDLEGPLEMVGSAVAKRAIAERRHIVTEVFGVDPAAMQALLIRMKGIGYATHIDFVRGDPERVEEWNLARGEDNVSSYHTDAFNLRWLMEAATEFAAGTSGDSREETRLEPRD